MTTRNYELPRSSRVLPHDRTIVIDWVPEALALRSEALKKPTESEYARACAQISIDEDGRTEDAMYMAALGRDVTADNWREQLRKEDAFTHLLASGYGPYDFLHAGIDRETARSMGMTPFKHDGFLHR